MSIFIESIILKSKNVVKFFKKSRCFELFLTIRNSLTYNSFRCSLIHSFKHGLFSKVDIDLPKNPNIFYACMIF